MEGTYVRMETDPIKQIAIFRVPELQLCLQQLQLSKSGLKSILQARPEQPPQECDCECRAGCSHRPPPAEEDLCWCALWGSCEFSEGFLGYYPARTPMTPPPLSP